MGEEGFLFLHMGGVVEKSVVLFLFLKFCWRHCIISCYHLYHHHTQFYFSILPICSPWYCSVYHLPQSYHRFFLISLTYMTCLQQLLGDIHGEENLRNMALTINV